MEYLLCVIGGVIITIGVQELTVYRSARGTPEKPLIDPTYYLDEQKKVFTNKKFLKEE